MAGGNGRADEWCGVSPHRVFEGCGFANAHRKTRLHEGAIGPRHCEMKEVESLHRSNGVFTDSGGPGNRIERSISDSDRSDRDRDGRSSAADGAGRTAEKAVGMGRRFGARRARVVFGCPA